MVKLELTAPSWVNGPGDNPGDLCLHGRVLLEVSGHRFISPSDGEWTVSGAALHLLRTLESDNLPGSRVSLANLLVPCCAHIIFPVEDPRYAVSTFGCPHGVELDIQHIEDDRLRICSPGDETSSVTTSLGEWRDAVMSFCKQVTDHYNSSIPKDFNGDDEAWDLFWAEWKARGANPPLGRAE